MNPKTPHSPERIQADVKVRIAVQQRMLGFTWEEIAAKLGYSSKGVVCKAVSRYLKRQHSATAEEYREYYTIAINKKLQQIEELTNIRRDPTTGEILMPDLNALDRWLKLMQERARIENIYPATKTEVTGANGGPLELATMDEYRVSILARLQKEIDASAVGLGQEEPSGLDDASGTVSGEISLGGTLGAGESTAPGGPVADLAD